MTDLKKDSLSICESQDAPEIIEKVKSTRYSIARRYGRVCVFGYQYVYRKESDCLIRADLYHHQKQSCR